MIATLATTATIRTHRTLATVVTTQTTRLPPIRTTQRLNSLRIVLLATHKPRGHRLLLTTIRFIRSRERTLRLPTIAMLVTTVTIPIRPTPATVATAQIMRRRPIRITAH